MALLEKISFQHNLLLLWISWMSFWGSCQKLQGPESDVWQYNRELSREVWLQEQGENINLNISKGKN